jgi:ATP-dependent RNA helicase DDX46/PRP5
MDSRLKRSRSDSPEIKSKKKSKNKDKDRDRSEKKKKRSKSKERHRSKSRERDRESRKKNGKDKRKSRSRSREKVHKDKSRDERPRSPKESVKESKDVIEIKDDQFDPAKFDKEEEQRRLELEMIKRKERIERWRAERKKKEIELQKKPEKPSSEPSAKPWSLEDDDEDEDVKIIEIEDSPTRVKDEPIHAEPPKKIEKIVIDDDDDFNMKIVASKKIVKPVSPELPKIEEKIIEEEVEDDDVDPLDAYMKAVDDEVRKINKMSKVSTTTTAKTTSGQAGLVIVTGNAKKQQKEIKKGELIEQNQDGLEYSSEEEFEDIKDTAANLATLKQKKELPKIDHTKMEYNEFKKNFYVEVPELAKMTQQEVDAYRTLLEDIQVKGKGCPKPIRTWAQCGVSKKEMDILRKLNFEKPTPIQCQAIPAIMSGRDLIGIAKTGSGKTISFIIPMFRHILDQPPLEDSDGPVSIIMTPTRELCMQIGKDIKKFSKSLGLRCVCVYGGTGISEQIAELKRGAEIIVCTPGRMIDMLAANSGRVTNLRRVTYVVCDEADRMFDMGFEPQVVRILENIRPDRQTVMFSATFPRQMEALARRFLKKPIEIQVGGRSVVCKEVEQHIAILEEEAKFFKLLELLGHYQEHGSIIAFVDKQENADILLKELMKASYPCMSLHGGIDQYDRDSTISDFKSGRCKLLIATSVAARGLDVKHLILVVNYDCPNHYEDYVHRVGRTGRAGNKGYAWTFLTPDQGRYSGDILRALVLSNTEVPVELQNLFDTYKEGQEAIGKKVYSGGGFSGKGFKFDEQEAAAANEMKKLQKAALGLVDSDDEDDLENDIDQTIESMFATKRTVKEIQAPIIPAAPQPAAPPPQAVPTASTDKLELAKKLASRINITKNLGAEAKGATQQAAEAIFGGKGNVSTQLITNKTIAEQIASKLNTKLNYQPKDDEDAMMEQTDGMFKKYEEELEINDFPQQARWKVTSKEALAQISEYSEAGLTVRGTFVPPGKPIPEGERKLYLAIESCSERAVSKAKSEITRLIKEELLKIKNVSHHLINKARYKVV